MQENLFSKLKWYPVKLLFLIIVLPFSMYKNYGLVLAVVCFIIIFWLLVYPIFMKDQTKNHLQEIRNSDMKYYDYFELGLEIKLIHTIAFVIMFPMAVFYGVLLFTAFVTLFVIVGGCVSYRWSSKIVKIGLDKAHEQNLLNEQEVWFYNICQYVFILDWLSLKYLDHKL